MSRTSDAVARSTAPSLPASSSSRRSRWTVVGGGRAVTVGRRDRAHHAHATGQEEDRIGERGRADGGDAEGAHHRGADMRLGARGRAAASPCATASRSAERRCDAVAPGAGRPRSQPASRARAAPPPAPPRSPCARRPAGQRSDANRSWIASTLLRRSKLAISRTITAPAPVTPAVTAIAASAPSAALRSNAAVIQAAASTVSQPGEEDRDAGQAEA